jgi:dipeptidyl-peptidase-4
MAAPHADSFPRQNARTVRFTLGRPRSFTVSPDGGTVLFVRSTGGTDRVGRLWRWTESGGEVCLVDPTELLGGHEEQLDREERARRERAREAAGGIVGYSVDQETTTVCFALSGRLFVCDVSTGGCRELDVSMTGAAVIDPRVDPTGRHVAFVSAGRLWVVDVNGSSPRAVSPDEGDREVSWGAADFVSAEELERSRGFWWSPDGEHLLAQRTDESPVHTWYVSNPATPELPSVPQRYPASGTANPAVSLALLGVGGGVTSVSLPDVGEYIATVSWSRNGAPVVGVLDRAQQTMTWVAVDDTSGAGDVVRLRTGEAWVDVVPGTGTWDEDGRLVTVEVVDDDYALCIDGVRLSPAGLDVRAVIDTADDILVVGSADPMHQQVWAIGADGSTCISPERGWHVAARGGPTTVMVSADLDHPLPTTVVTVSGSDPCEIESFSETPIIEPRVHLLPEAPRSGAPRVAVLFPRGHEPGSGTLPVLMDPYGGPHFARITAHQAAFRESQWFADQGFAVVVVDGRGTPGSPTWERGVHGDFAGPVLDDQIVGLHAAAHAFTDLDLDAVAIRGWSFGGYLAALAVIDRPEVFHAGIAGAPVTDWALYDTGYTERYLGVPDSNVAESLEPYTRSSLLERAASLRRPLQIIHGLADDNVFVAHALRLSQVLVENGRPHEVLPLSGITHMATQEDVAENLLLLQVDFLRRALTRRSD